MLGILPQGLGRILKAWNCITCESWGHTDMRFRKKSQKYFFHEEMKNEEKPVLMKQGRKH